MTSNNPDPCRPARMKVRRRVVVTFPATDWFPPVVPGRAAEIVELAREFRAALDEVPGALYQLGEAGLSDLMTQLMGVHFPVLRRWRPWS